MKINKNTSLQEIQSNFGQLYPGLKIVFYESKHAIAEGSSKDEEIEDLTRQVMDFRESLDSEHVDMNPLKTIAEVESEFEEKFGMHVQIFRRSNDLWLQTTATDGWTLETQNSKGLHSIGEY